MCEKKDKTFVTANLIITRVRRLDPGRGCRAGTVRVRAGRIARSAGPDAVTMAGGGRLLTPGLIDVHCHGLERWSFDNGPAEMLAAAARFPATA